MKIIPDRYYAKFRTDRQAEIKRIVRSEVRQNTMMMKAMESRESMLNHTAREEKIILSLTTFGKRINSVYLAIESIAQQTMKPDKVILWLSDESYSDDKLPLTLKRLKNRGLSVEYRKDVGPHTKLLYAIKEQPEDIIITVDDDIIYPIDLIENLVATHYEYPNKICCNVARIICKDTNNTFTPYNSWEKISDKRMVSNSLMPLGVNGVLYPPKSFDDNVFREDLIESLCPHNDDVWFKVLSLKNNINVVSTGSYCDFNDHYSILDSSFIDALAVENITNKRNDSQFIDCMNYFQLKI